MSILFILIPISIFLGTLGLAAFFWALKSDQFSDLEGDALRILIDREPDEVPQEEPAEPTPDQD